jgi:aryl-alcohol dehydrogenase-like predicted oxidoreductase
MGGTIDDSQTHEILSGAVDSGINFIDLADVYARGQAERVAGEWLLGRDRTQLVISSKVYWPMSDGINDRGLSRKHIMESCEASLRRLGTDYLDIYFCHRFDEDTPLHETVRAMDDLIRQGKVLYWGTSCWTSAQLKEAHRIAKALGAYAPIVEQPRYNLVDRHVEADIMGTVKKLGMGLVVWSPLAGGFLTGKYNRDTKPKGSRADTSTWLDSVLTPTNIDRSRALSSLAKEAGLPVHQLALAWILTHDEVSSAITGASRVEQLRSNIEAVNIVLSDDLRDQIETIFS